MAISLLPLLWELEQPLSTQQQFIYGMSHRDLSRPWHEYYAWKAEASEEELENSHLDTKKDIQNLEIHLEARHFAPAEMTVKTADGFIKVGDFHLESRDDHGLEPRQFVSPDGILTESAPKDGTESSVPLILQGEVEDINEFGVGKKEPKENVVDREVEGKEEVEKKPEKKVGIDKEPEEEEDVEKKSNEKENLEKEPNEKDPEKKGQ